MTNVLKAIQVCFLAALLMLLNISLPIVLTKINNDEGISRHEKAEKNPFSNSTEEKTTSNTVNIAEEYVHDVNLTIHLSPWQISVAYIHAHEAAYTAYHGELHYPPPNITS